MFKFLFTDEDDLRRHRTAPFLKERQAYLRKRHDEGIGVRFLKGLADLLLVIIDRLRLQEGDISEIPLETIVQQDKEWNALSKEEKLRCHVPVAHHDCFLGTAQRWLTYLGRLDHRYYPEDNLISQIFTRGFFRVRHLVAPMFQDRLDYLEAQKNAGAPDVTLRRIAQYQLTAIEMLDLGTISRISMEEIDEAAKRWRNTSIPQRRKKAGSTKSYESFVNITSRWLSFMGLLKPESKPCFPGSDKVEDYLEWLSVDKGGSPQTRKSRLSMLRKLMFHLSESDIELARLQPSDIDGYLKHCHDNGCCRRTIAGMVSVFRCFFRYAAEKQWVTPGVWKALSAPRMYSLESLPSYLHWDDVKDILKESSQKTTPPAIRNHAVLSLLAMYGLRSGEIVNLKLKDVDWRNGEIRLQRVKGCRPQIMPLIDEVAQPLLRYIMEVRATTPTQEHVFLTMRAPFRQITTSTVYQIASNALKGKSIGVKHHGPHCFRHSCATRLVNEGYSLKEVADVLGHVKIDTTAIYAKVNFGRLREVSDMSWKEVLEI